MCCFHRLTLLLFKEKPNLTSAYINILVVFSILKDINISAILLPNLFPNLPSVLEVLFWQWSCSLHLTMNAYWRYTLEDAHSPTVLRIKPFLAFRNIHKLCRANVFVERKYEAIENGIKYRMYSGYSNLFMQFSKKVEYTHAPDWNYNIEYTQEQLRGYDYQEDLFIPGFFELPIKKGESIVLSVGTSEKNPTMLKKLFTTEIKHRIPRDSFVNNLINSAHQFIMRRDKKTEVMAGFPWFGRWGRDTFIALPGITLAIDDPKTCKAIIDTMVSELHGPLFPNVGHGNQAVYNSTDAPLWFFWALSNMPNIPALKMLSGKNTAVSFY